MKLLEGYTNFVSARRRVRQHFSHVRKLKVTWPAFFLAGRTMLEVGLKNGIVVGEDGSFLLSLLEKAQPKHVVEIGVFAGGSSLLMLRYFLRSRKETRLTSVDLIDHCYDDPSKKLGYLVFEKLSGTPRNWLLLIGYGASTLHKAPQLPEGTIFDFAFVDAHHGHPWPTLDTLCLLPSLAPGSWVALHDVSLSLILNGAPLRGPQYLFEEWPFEKLISSGSLPNIGAIRLSEDRNLNVHHLIRVAETAPWDNAVDPDSWAAITERLSGSLTESQMDVLTDAYERHRHLPFS